jgi:hypothetical protein
MRQPQCGRNLVAVTYNAGLGLELAGRSEIGMPCHGGTRVVAYRGAPNFKAICSSQVFSRASLGEHLLEREQ